MGAVITYVENGPIDDAELTRLIDLAFAGTASGDPTAWSARLHAHSVGWVCAYTDGRLCGFVHACWDGGKHAFVLDTAVLPEMQRHGIGAELLRHLTAIARRAGCEWLHVDYEPGHDGFYQAAGFRPTLAGVRKLN